MIPAVGYYLLDRGQEEKFEMIFDENLIFGPNAKLWYPLTRDVSLPELFSILPPEPIFKSDNDVLPLQAADMLAWLLRRSWNSQSQEFGWIIVAL